MFGRIRVTGRIGLGFAVLAAALIVAGAQVMLELQRLQLGLTEIGLMRDSDRAAQDLDCECEAYLSRVRDWRVGQSAEHWAKAEGARERLRESLSSLMGVLGVGGHAAGGDYQDEVLARLAFRLDEHWHLVEMDKPATGELAAQSGLLRKETRELLSAQGRDGAARIAALESALADAGLAIMTALGLVLLLALVVSVALAWSVARPLRGRGGDLFREMSALNEAVDLMAEAGRSLREGAVEQVAALDDERRNLAELNQAGHGDAVAAGDLARLAAGLARKAARMEEMLRKLQILQGEAHETASARADLGDQVKGVSLLAGLLTKSVKLGSIETAGGEVLDRALRAGLDKLSGRAEQVSRRLVALGNEGEHAAVEWDEQLLRTTEALAELRASVSGLSETAMGLADAARERSRALGLIARDSHRTDARARHAAIGNAESAALASELRARLGASRENSLALLSLSMDTDEVNELERSAKARAGQVVLKAALEQSAALDRVNQEQGVILDGVNEQKVEKTEDDFPRPLGARDSRGLREKTVTAKTAVKAVGR